MCRPSDEFTCNFRGYNTHCIPKAWVCDMDNDCADNLDEQNCGKYQDSSQNSSGLNIYVLLLMCNFLCIFQRVFRYRTMSPLTKLYVLTWVGSSH